MLTVFFIFFFFKQKTAYEMRISDWSSDVCSSDLKATVSELGGGQRIRRPVVQALRAQILLAQGNDAHRNGGMTEQRMAAHLIGDVLAAVPRSEERRVGKEGGSTCRSRWSEVS